ncbi:MAG: indolepyruvate ferredoxin oxidoreductase family protein, partial [Proteobacteria bacterium]|nr:indolepyruvate ferredoxin oxidoreductase family protein [Pseudomonadota bacterium]
GLYKVGCIWPLEPQGLTEFATPCQELLFIEEKSAIIQPQAAEILYNQAQRPRIVGKYDEAGTQLFPSDVMLDAREIAAVIGQRLVALELADADLQACIAELSQDVAVNVGINPAAQRTPYFCSGCPHNTSTKVPEGSNALAGIGCHTMAMFNKGYTIFPTQMGGEGLNWCGMSHFTHTKHVFQNLGDGTYYHSGLLAIRGAIASGANITYKILFNDATAMTGGQPADGPISVADISYQVLHEGAKKCVVLTDTPEAYNSQSGLAEGVKVYHRDELDRIQRELREVPGCTVLIYEQTCAAEKRRRRKRGTFPDPAKRLFINDAVCEGCSDCSVQSTCVSIMPQETALGTRRRIDQSSCNKDYSCVKGFCPSFVTVLGAEPKKRRGKALDSSLFDDLPVPVQAPVGEGSYDIMIAGIGGTGVITVGALLGMAAHMEGRACSIYDMTGLSQKNGAVYSHLRIADSNDVVFAQRMGAGDADLLLGFDLIAALQGDAAPVYAQGHTQVIGNAQVSTTSGFQFDSTVRPDTGLLQRQITERVGEGSADFIDATGMALALLGNTIGSNLFLMGYAAQRGLIPVGIDAIVKAVELNGVAVEFNLNAFNLGRLLAHSPKQLMALLPQSKPSTELAALGLDELIDHRSDLLTQYQNSAYADRYVQLVHRVRSAEQSLYPEQDELTRAVAHGYAKLMAYKDEYEVARHYADPAFMQKLNADFEDGYKLRFNLAPPLLSRRDPQTGHLIKREFGGWLLGGFKVLAKFKGLRGGALDIFGYSAERRGERQLISDYEQLISQLLGELNEANYSSAVQLANLPEEIRGYGHVKEANIEKVKLQQQELLAQFKNPDSNDKIPVALVAS